MPDKKVWWEKMVKKTKGISLCDRCDAVYYDGHWHTNAELATILRDSKKSEVSHDFCFTCKNIVENYSGPDAGFVGEVVLDGIEDPEEKHQILTTIRNFSRKAFIRDPEEQIIDITDKGERVIITTSKGDLAVGIGKSVDKAFKGGTLQINFSDDDMPVRVHWVHKNTYK